MHPITFFFNLQHTVKLYHWMTTSFARHQASDRLHSELVSSIDSFMETFIGRYGRPKLGKKDLALNIVNLSDSTAPAFIEEACRYLNNDIKNYVANTDTDLLNIRDEILGQLNQTKYLFTLQ